MTTAIISRRPTFAPVKRRKTPWFVARRPVQPEVRFLLLLSDSPTVGGRSTSPTSEGGARPLLCRGRHRSGKTLSSDPRLTDSRRDTPDSRHGTESRVDHEDSKGTCESGHWRVAPYFEVSADVKARPPPGSTST